VSAYQETPRTGEGRKKNSNHILSSAAASVQQNHASLQHENGRERVLIMCLLHLLLLQRRRNVKTPSKFQAVYYINQYNFRSITFYLLILCLKCMLKQRYATMVVNVCAPITNSHHFTFIPMGKPVSNYVSFEICEVFTSAFHA
jgi:hypothetical protein